MSGRSFFRGAVWTVVAVLLLVHIGAGWMFSSQLVDEAFTPSPSAIEMPEGNYQLVEATYRSRLGEMDAWLLPADGTTWVIHVHGLGATPAEAEHLFAPLQQAGYPQLAITYRNDEGQPLDPSGYYRYGVTEWEDVAGAVELARESGARAVVLSGFGAGASHVLAYLYRNNLELIRGLVFDAPNVDLGDTVQFAATQTSMPLVPMTVPRSITAVARFMASLRTGVNWGAIDYVGQAGPRLRRPVLVHHGTADLRVPLSQSMRLAAASPEWVRVIAVPDATHVGSYEVDPDGYVAAVLAFLDEVSPP